MVFIPHGWETEKFFGKTCVFALSTLFPTNGVRTQRPRRLIHTCAVVTPAVLRQYSEGSLLTGRNRTVRRLAAAVICLLEARGPAECGRRA